MIISTPEQYAAAKVHLEAMGFTNVPSDANIDYSVPQPSRLTVSMLNYNKTTVPANTNLLP